MDKVPQLGQLLPDEGVERDAIHIAIAPVIAGETLMPGEPIGFTGNAYTVGADAKIIGIVDPFLKNRVNKGDRFYIFLTPNTITSLKHNWTHPEFEKEDVLSSFEPTFFKLQGHPESEKWITDYAERIGSNYTEIMTAAADYQTDGDYLVRGGTFEGEYIPDEFWNHYEKVTRKTVDDRGSFLSCSC